MGDKTTEKGVFQDSWSSCE